LASWKRAPLDRKGFFLPPFAGEQLAGPIFCEQSTPIDMGKSSTLEGEPAGKPDKRMAGAYKGFSRMAGEGSRRTDEGDRAGLERVEKSNALTGEHAW